MNLSGTTHLKLESRPASRNFPDSASLEDKKRTLWIAAASPFVCIHVRIFSKRIETFSSFLVWECLTKQDVGECGITWRVFLLLVYTLYRCRYINLINLYRILLGNFHHQDLFSLNLDLVYGGIRLVNVAWVVLHRKSPHWS